MRFSSNLAIDDRSNIAPVYSNSLGFCIYMVPGHLESRASSLIGLEDMLGI